MLETLLKGQAMMIPLMICSVLALAVFVDRLLAFYSNSKVDTRALRAQLMTLLRRQKVKDAAVLCATTPGPISAVLLSGLQSYMKLLKKTPENTRITVGQAVEDYSHQSIGAVEKRLWILATIGSAAPLLGMTGTVTGMIKAFDKMAKTEIVNAATVSGGISEALVTTAAGLIIALAAVIPYSIFASMSDKIELEIEESSTEMIDLLATQFDPDKLDG